jgi:hypothetical protein
LRYHADKPWRDKEAVERLRRRTYKLEICAKSKISAAFGVLVGACSATMPSGDLYPSIDYWMPH